MQSRVRGVPVRYDDQVAGTRQGGDFQGLGQPASPIDVRLQDIQRFSVDKALEAPAGVFVLGAGEWDRDRVHDPAIAVDTVGHDALFQPARLEFLDPLNQLDRVDRIEGLPAIQRDGELVAYGP